jgi:outer membrane receptor protein involved in Fe transport
MKCVVGGGIAIGLLLAVRAGAQQKQPSPHYGGTAERTTVPAASRATPSRATLSVDGVTLREALRVIAKEWGKSVSYSSDVVPVTRRVSVHVRNAAVGEALDSALAGTGVVARVWSATQIVLEPAAPNATRATPEHADAVGRVTDAESGAPVDRARVTVDDTGRAALSGADGSFRLTGVSVGPHRVTARRVGYAPATRSVAFLADSEITIDLALHATARPLDEVVVTGTVASTAVRAVPSPITVLSWRDIEQSGVTQVDALFRGGVPGAVDIDNGTHDGYPGLTFRGGIDFNQGVSGATAKVYVDGVELAYGNAISQIDPKSIDHIEITRGPQSSTLYGAGAMVGVIQIFTKHGSASLTHPQVDAQVSAGGVQSQWASGETLHQDHTLGVSAGNAQFDYAARGSYTSTGQWAPEYDSKRAAFSGRVGGNLGGLRLDLTGQYSHRVYHVAPIDPYMARQVRDSAWHTSFDAFYAKPFHPSDTRSDGAVGLTAGFSTARWWEHHIVLGYDGYDNPRGSTAPRFTRPADSLRAFGEYRTGRASVAYNTTLSAHLGPSVTSALTLGADYWSINEFGISASQHADGSFASGALVSRDSYDNTGVFAQLQLGLANRLFLTGGVRGDRNSNFGSGYGLAIAPRAGVSYAATAGGVAYKLRASYGVAIQPPAPFQKAAISVAAPFSIQIANPNLGPERQRGGDAGVDLYFGQHVSLAATYYNQRVDDMITTVILSGPEDTTQIGQNQNIGRIKNTGLEFQSTVHVAPFSFTGTYSVFHSTVQRINAGALGDGRGQYHVGDRLLLIPRSSGGFTTGLDLGQTHLQAGLTYIGSFRNYDRIAYGNAIYGGQGTPLAARAYIIDYPSVFKWNAGVTQALRGGVSAFVRVDNLTNSYASEIDNITAVYGRLTVIGLRAQW